MKTFLKILLLVLAAAGAVFGVLYWQKTRVEPPLKPSLDNDNYEQLVDHVKAINDGDDIDKAFDKVFDELCFLNNEMLIDSAQRDEQLRLLVDDYAPQFAANALTALRNTWTYNQLNRLKNRAKLLSELTSTQGDKVIVDSDVTSKFSTINKVYNDYAKANAIAANTAFRTESDAKNRLSDAKRYCNDPYLSHCTALVDRLKGLPAKIGRSHFSKVSASVNSFARAYRNCSDVIAKKREIRSMISQYEAMTPYYGRNEGSAGLSAKLNNIPDSPYDL